MAAGFIYVLQNKAFGANVIKIGLTTRTPDIRAREIYAGSTGVPLPFEVAVAYSVTDCKKAEETAHRNLKSYRLNNRREFFRISPSVGSSVVHRVCLEVNREQGAPAPVRFAFPPTSNPTKPVETVLSDEEDSLDSSPKKFVNIQRLIHSPVGTSALTDDQIARAEILCCLLTKLNPVERDKWLQGFTRDEHPERELRIWESMAKAYLTLEHADDAPEGFRREAFSLLLERTWLPTSEALARVSLTYFSRANAKRLLDAYELRPKPVVISRRLRKV